MQVVEQENRLRASGGRTQPDKPTLPDVKPAIAQFDQLKPGRRCVVSLPQPAARVSGTVMSSDGNGKASHTARFTAAVLDVDAAAAKQAVRDCAVFIVPQVSLTCSTVESKEKKEKKRKEKKRKEKKRKEKKRKEKTRQEKKRKEKKRKEKKRKEKKRKEKNRKDYAFQPS